MEIKLQLALAVLLLLFVGSNCAAGAASSSSSTAPAAVPLSVEALRRRPTAATARRMLLQPGKETNEFHVGGSTGARRPAMAAKGGEGFDASMRPIPNSNSNRKHN